MIGALAGLMSPAGAGARLSTLIFHRVLPKPDLLFPADMHARRFDEICERLRVWFNVLPADEAAQRLKAGTLPARAACITFDDGYADNCHVAVPILRRHGLTATFFIATGFMDGGRMWNDTIATSVRTCPLPELDLSSLGLGCHAMGSTQDRRAAIAALIGKIKYLPFEQRIAVTEQLAQLAQVQLPENLMVTSDDVRAMHRAGMQIGAHTMSHPILAKLTDSQARHEIGGSKDFLEQLLGARVGLFAYPNGKPGEDYAAQNVDAVRSLGFDAAFSTQWGASRTGDDVFQIRRFTPWDQTNWRFGLRMLANFRT